MKYTGRCQNDFNVQGYSSRLGGLPHPAPGRPPPRPRPRIISDCHFAPIAVQLNQLYQVSDQIQYTVKPLYARFPIIFSMQLNHFIPGFRSYSVAVRFLKWHSDFPLPWPAAAAGPSRISDRSRACTPPRGATPPAPCMAAARHYYQQAVSAVIMIIINIQ